MHNLIHSIVSKVSNIPPINFVLSIVLEASINRAVRISERGFEQQWLFMNLKVYYDERLNELDSDPNSGLSYTAVNPQFYWCHWALGWDRQKSMCFSMLI